MANRKRAKTSLAPTKQLRRHAPLFFARSNFSGRCFSLVIVWLLQNEIGEKSGATALLTYVPQHPFGLVPLGCLFVALKRRNGRLIVLNCVSVAFWGLALLGLQLPSVRFDRPPSLRVVTYNCLGGKASDAQIARELRAQKPDIVCLQESHGGFGGRVARHFPGWTSKSVGDVTTLSRFALVSSRVHPQQRAMRLLECVWQTPQGKVRVFNVHTAMRRLGQPRPATGSRLSRILGEHGQKAQARLDQLPDLERLPRDDLPTLLCGDFNTPPRGLFYRAISSKWSDAFAQSGWGLGQTYPAKLPLLRIDYVWMRGLEARRAWVGEARGSDHLPLVCDVRVLP